MRTKENADDYRYFPEPDIPPVEISIQRSEELKNSIGELANVKLIRYITKYRLNEKDAQYICSDPELASFFDRCVQSARFSPLDYSRRIMSELAKYLNDTNKSFEDTKLDVKRFNELMEEVDKGSISNSAFKKAFIALAETDLDVKKIINDLGLLQLADENELERIAERVLKENPKSADDYKRGKTNALGYLMGQCMKISNGKANPVRMKEILLSHLAKK
jgi:aspartyl-tRNA(Asn)/glutamyl-tRNA(Gln) amidotransferase subunit B